MGRVHCEVKPLEDWARFQRRLNIGLDDDCEMIQMEFNSVLASEAGDYFQVLFENQEDNLEGRYFLIQCQFEFPDEGEFYIENNDTRLCGHFEVKAVLGKLGDAATKLREKLGESLQTIEKFDASVEQATTSSLESLKAYSMGLQLQMFGKTHESLPFHKRAIELDPNFASAHQLLGIRRVSTTLRHRPVEFSVAPALSPVGRPARWAD